MLGRIVGVGVVQDLVVSGLIREKIREIMDLVESGLIREKIREIMDLVVSGLIREKIREINGTQWFSSPRRKISIHTLVVQVVQVDKLGIRGL
jgi:hypothetical protein